MRPDTQSERYRIETMSEPTKPRNPTKANTATAITPAEQNGDYQVEEHGDRDKADDGRDHVGSKSGVTVTVPEGQGRLLVLRGYECRGAGLSSYQRCETRRPSRCRRPSLDTTRFDMQHEVMHVPGARSPRQATFAVWGIVDAGIPQLGSREHARMRFLRLLLREARQGLGRVPHG